jgi:hypothetical protein
MNDRTVEIFHGLSPTIQMHAATMLTVARQAGVPLVLISGHRTPEENLRVGGASGSHHLTGMAFDVAVLGYTRDQVPMWWWAMLGAWAEENLGLTWGGRFVHNGARDVNHFDLRNLIQI